MLANDNDDPAHEETEAAENQARYRDVTEASRIYLLPNLFTAGNMFFGYLAIIRCIQARYGGFGEAMTCHFYTQAVWCILFACICDTLDGRLARLGGRESLFGKEFDSIADAVSFGVAPSLMVFFQILSPTERYPFFQQVGWFIGFIYLLCVGVRLARFNVLTHPLLNDSDGERDPGCFVGLPSPAAAGTIASLVLVLNSFDLRRWAIFLPVLMLLIAWLMISHIPYPSFKKLNWHTRAPAHMIIVVMMVILALIRFQEHAFALVFLSYIFYGLIRHWRRRILTPRKLRTESLGDGE